MVAVALDSEVITTLRECLQRGFDVSNVEARFGYGETNFGHGCFGLRLASIRLEKDSRGHFAVQSRIFNGLLRLGIQPGCVRVALTTNVRRDRAFEFRLALLLEDGGTEHCVVEGRSAESDERVFVRSLETLLICARHP